MNPGKILVYIICFCLSGEVWGQASLKGRVLDTASSPVSFASVGLLKANDSLLIKGSISTEQGEILFENIRPGDYLIKIIAVGYDETYSPVLHLDSAGVLQLPDIAMRSKGVVLDEVSVTAIKRTVEFKDGMIIMNVENSPLASGNTALDLLKRLPGVYVDNQNTVFLNGKAGVRIMIDGKIQRLPQQQLTAVLNGMTAESITKIEVMNNPPAKYDAEGTGGMINIVTKKVKLIGVSGNISAGGSHGIANRGATDGSLNYKGRKFTFFSNAGYGNRIFYSNYVFDKTVPFNGNVTYLKELGEQINYQQVFYYKAGMDFYLSEKTTVGFFINGEPASTPFTDIGNNKISGYNGLGYDHTPYNVKVTDNWSNPGYNVNAEHRFDTLGTQLNFSADYSNYKGARVALSQNPFLDANNNEVLPANVYRNSTLTNIRIFTQKLDFVKNMTKSIFMETGLKATFTDSRNDYTFERKNDSTGVFQNDTNYSNKYVYHENILAAYLNFKKQFKKASLQLGGRGENTIVDAHNTTSGFKLTRNYFYFFPNLTFDYPRSDLHDFQVSLTRRIDRPGYKDLNPFKSYQDNYSSTMGNPYLLPQTEYNLSFTYSYKHFLYNTFTYSRYANFMLGFDFQNDSTKETTSTSRNINGSNYVSYNLFLQKKISKWWNFTASGSVFYQDYQGTIVGTNINRSAFAYNAFVSNDILLPKNFKMQIAFSYVSPSVYGINYINQRWSLDIGMKKTLLKDKLTISFSVFDIFYKNVFSMHAKFQNMDYIFIAPNDTRRAWLNISYKFGKIKVQKRQVLSNEQEKQRLDDKLKN